MYSVTKEQLHQLSKGNKKVFRALFDLFYPRLIGLSMKYLKDLPASEDIVSEVFAKIWERKSEITVHGSFESFLYTSVKNSVINYIRNTSLHQNHHKRILNELNEDDFYESVMEETVHHNLYLAISELPEKGRKIFEYSVIYDWKDKEIAEEFGISINTVKTHKKRALKTLREKLGKLFLVLFLNL